MDDGRIISLRMGPEEIQSMDQFLEGHPELGGRSLFIRTAVREYIARDADVPAAETPIKKGDGVTVKLSPADIDTLEELTKRGVYNDVGQAVWYFVHEKIREMVREDEMVHSIYDAAVTPDLR